MELPEQKTLTKEEIRNQCLFCQLADGKIPSLTLYQDDKLLCFMDIRPANLGHILIIPKEHYAIFNQMPDDLIEHFGIISKKVSMVLIKTLNAGGTNIFIANGAIAGQRAPHFILHVIPRFENDALGKLNPNKTIIGQDKVIATATKLKAEISKIMNIKIKETVINPKKDEKENKENSNKSISTKKENRNSDKYSIYKTFNISKNSMVYDDGTFFAFVPEKQISNGSVLLTTKEHKIIIEKVSDEDFGNLFKIANKIMIVLFEIMNAQGTNLLIQNGTVAGQEFNHFTINIIPRFENDGLDFQWEPKKVSQEELKSTFDLISSASNLIFVDKAEKINIIEEKDTEVIDLDTYNSAEEVKTENFKTKNIEIVGQSSQEKGENLEKPKEIETAMEKDKVEVKSNEQENPEDKNIIHKGKNYLFEQLERLP